MKAAPAGGSLPPRLPADELRAAFRKHGRTAGWPWAIEISDLPSLPAPDGKPAEDAAAPCVRLDLTGEDARALAGVLQDAADLGRGSGRRGPNWLWLGSAEAARRVGVQPSTIRAWVSGRGPRNHPFPRPDRSIKGRNFWRKKTIDEWIAERDPDE